MKARAHIALMRQDFSKEISKQKALQSMKETRLIQNSLNAAAEQKNVLQQMKVTSNQTMEPHGTATGVKSKLKP